jgi:hypothetical protein
VRLGVIASGEMWAVEAEGKELATHCLQPLLDAFVAREAGVTIDYVHGEEEVFRIAGREEEHERVAIMLPPVKKAGFFGTVAKGGPLPRKSFSMGEALEKRFYLECRKLT